MLVLKHNSLPSDKLVKCEKTMLSFIDNKLTSRTGMYFNVWDWSIPELYGIVLGMMVKLDLSGCLQIRNSEMLDFIIDVKKGYNRTEYHSFYHAVDVVAVLYYMLTDLGAAKYLTPLESICLMIAGLCHDIGHPGLNNVYQVNAQTPLARKYNNQSVLENYSCTLTKELLTKHKLFRHLHNCNIDFLGCDPKEVDSSLKSLIEKTILATDMMHHFKLLESLHKIIKSTKSSSKTTKKSTTSMNHSKKKSYCSSPSSDSFSSSSSSCSSSDNEEETELDGDDNDNDDNSIDSVDSCCYSSNSSIDSSPESSPISISHSSSFTSSSLSSSLDQEQRENLLKILLHAADLSNTVRPWDISKHWSDLVVEEFFKQGDLEKRKNLPVSPNMDREQAHQSQISLGFGDFVVKPYFEAFALFLNQATIFLDILARNRVSWDEINNNNNNIIISDNDNTNTASNSVSNSSSNSISIINENNNNAKKNDGDDNNNGDDNNDPKLKTTRSIATLTKEITVSANVPNRPDNYNNSKPDNTPSINIISDDDSKEASNHPTDTSNISSPVTSTFTSPPSSPSSPYPSTSTTTTSSSTSPPTISITIPTSTGQRRVSLAAGLLIIPDDIQEKLQKMMQSSSSFKSRRNNANGGARLKRSLSGRSYSTHSLLISSSDDNNLNNDDSVNNGIGVGDERCNCGVVNVVVVTDNVNNNAVNSKNNSSDNYNCHGGDVSRNNSARKKSSSNRNNHHKKHHHSHHKDSSSSSSIDNNNNNNNNINSKNNYSNNNNNKHHHHYHHQKCISNNNHNNNSNGHIGGRRMRRSSSLDHNIIRQITSVYASSSQMTPPQTTLISHSTAITKSFSTSSTPLPLSTRSPLSSTNTTTAATTTTTTTPAIQQIDQRIVIAN